MDCHSPVTTVGITGAGSIALVGHPNVGKSVLFQRLTGQRAVVPNYPGTTVEIARAAIRDLPDTVLVDTPGVIAFPPRSDDERVTEQLLFSEPLKAILQVGDALLRAGLAAFVIAVGTSVFVSRRVISPVQEMTTTSQYITDGHYDHRVEVPWNISSGDLDELAQLAISFNSMAENIHQTENMRRRLIGDVSHELHTTLTSIKGSLEGLIDGVLPPTPVTFQNIYRETVRLQRLVADLQELYSVESGAISLNLHPINISQQIETIFQQMHVTIQA